MRGARAIHFYSCLYFICFGNLGNSILHHCKKHYVAFGCNFEELSIVQRKPFCSKKAVRMDRFLSRSLETLMWLGISRERFWRYSALPMKLERPFIKLQSRKAEHYVVLRRQISIDGSVIVSVTPRYSRSIELATLFYLDAISCSKKY